MPQTVICMVGLSNSGKTEAVRKMLRLFRCRDIAAMAINRDSLRLALYGNRYDPEREQEISQLEELYVKASFLYGYDVVIIDACHHTETARWRWAVICQREGWDLKFEVLDTPVEECIRRAQSKGDDYIIEVIKRQAEEADFWDGV